MRGLNVLMSHARSLLGADQREPHYRPSETAKCRRRLARYCTGFGIDISRGDEPIRPSAIRFELLHPYAHSAGAGAQLCGEVADLHWFQDGALDYVFCSHVLEDFEDTEFTLREWLRVLRPGGTLCLYCVDEAAYRHYCRTADHPYDANHVHEEFSLESVFGLLKDIGGVEVVYSRSLVDIFCWDLVCEKVSGFPYT